MLKAYQCRQSLSIVKNCWVAILFGLQSCEQNPQKSQTFPTEKPIVYYDSLWNRTQADKATYFRKTITKDTLIERCDYTMIDSILVRKEVYSFDGKRNGEFYDALTDRTLTGQFRNNNPVLLLEYQTGKPHQAKIETVFDDKGREKFKLFYDEEGVYIGTYHFLTETRGNGTLVQYRFPEMKVAKIEQYNKEQQLVSEFRFTLDNYMYYKFQRESNTQGREIYLNADGEKIAELQVVKQGQHYVPYDGTQLNISWKTGKILGKTLYIAYQKECDYKYDENGELRQEDTYVEGRKTTTLYYYQTNKKPEQLLYDLDENPYEGILYDNIFAPKSRIRFKEGKLVQKQSYLGKIMRQSEDLDEKKKQTKYRIYDSNGKLAYAYTLDNTVKNIKEKEIEIISFRKNKVISKAYVKNELLVKGKIKFYQKRKLVEYIRKGGVLIKKYFDDNGKISNTIQVNADIRANDPLFDEIRFRIEQLYDPVSELQDK